MFTDRQTAGHIAQAQVSNALLLDRRVTTETNCDVGTASAGVDVHVSYVLDDSVTCDGEWACAGVADAELLLLLLVVVVVQVAGRRSTRRARTCR